MEQYGEVFILMHENSQWSAVSEENLHTTKLLEVISSVIGISGVIFNVNESIMDRWTSRQRRKAKRTHNYHTRERFAHGRWANARQGITCPKLHHRTYRYWLPYHPLTSAKSVRRAWHRPDWPQANVFYSNSTTQSAAFGRHAEPRVMKHGRNALYGAQTRPKRAGDDRQTVVLPQKAWQTQDLHTFGFAFDEFISKCPTGLETLIDYFLTE